MTNDSAPSIEERLPAALTEIADSVSIEEAAFAWTDDEALPRARRTRAWVAAGIAAVLAIVVAIAVSAATSDRDSGRPAPVSDTTPTTTGVAFVDDGPLTSPRIYQKGLITLLPPAPGVRPRITARQAYNAKMPRRCPKTGEVLTEHLVLTNATIFDYGQAHNNGSVTPFINHRLVWVSTLADIPYECIVDRGDLRAMPGITTTTPPPNTQLHATELNFFDATTGAFLNGQSFGGSFTTSTVTEALLAGTWYPRSIAGFEGTLSDAPGISFDGRGKWFGNDGCNGLSGAYHLGKWDAFEAGPVLSTLGLCVNGPAPIPISGVVTTATRAELVNGELRFFAPDMHELARFGPGPRS